MTVCAGCICLIALAYKISAQLLLTQCSLQEARLGRQMGARMEQRSTGIAHGGYDMKRSFFSLVLIVAMAAAAPLARAVIIPLHVNLSGANEFPANASQGTGVAYFQLNTADPAFSGHQSLTGHIEFSGLTGNTTAAHIHCCLASPFLTNTNVGVATLVPAFPVSRLGSRAASTISYWTWTSLRLTARGSSPTRAVWPMPK